MLSTAKRRRPNRIRPVDPDPGPPSLAVVVLMGGVGTEREVSLSSGRAVVKGLEQGGHRVAVHILESSDPAELDTLPSSADVVFLALHGEYGEDGTIQHELASRGVCYTGSGPEASARAFDKVRTKRILARAGLPLADQRVLEFPFSPRSLRHAVRTAPPGKVVVKPARMGSSVGVVICEERFQLVRALQEGARFRQPLLIEEFVSGHELTCGILGGVPLPVVEAVPKRGFFDYQAKYDKSCQTEYVVDPAGVSTEVKEEIKRLSYSAHCVLGCDDFSRVDFRYDPTTGRLIILEVNTIPGLTPTSLLPKAAAAAGIPFEQLVDRMCRLALRAFVP